MILSDDQIGFFRAHGYLAPLRAVDEEEAAECRRRLEEFEAETGRSATETLHMKSHLYFSWLWRLARCPAIVGSLEDLLGRDILILGSRLWIKEPHDAAFVTWHQDTAYFGIEPQELLTLWLAMTDATPENGSMRFIPGSHLDGPRHHAETRDPNNLLSRGQAVEDADESRAIDLSLRAGEFSIHHGQLLHSSPPNESDDRRIGFALMVMPTHVRSTLGRRSVTLLCGEDAHGHWDLDPVPTRDRDPVIWRLMHEANQAYRDAGVSQDAARE